MGNACRSEQETGTHRLSVPELLLPTKSKPSQLTAVTHTHTHTHSSVYWWESNFRRLTLALKTLKWFWTVFSILTSGYVDLGPIPFHPLPLPLSPTKDSQLLTQDPPLYTVPMVWNGIYTSWLLSGQSFLPWRQLGTTIHSHLEVL